MRSGIFEWEKGVFRLSREQKRGYRQKCKNSFEALKSRKYVWFPTSVSLSLIIQMWTLKARNSTTCPWSPAVPHTPRMWIPIWSIPLQGPASVHQVTFWMYNCYAIRAPAKSKSSERWWYLAKTDWVQVVSLNARQEDLAVRTIDYTFYFEKMFYFYLCVWVWVYACESNAHEGQRH